MRPTVADLADETAERVRFELEIIIDIWEDNGRWRADAYMPFSRDGRPFETIWWLPTKHEARQGLLDNLRKIGKVTNDLERKFGCWLDSQGKT